MSGDRIIRGLQDVIDGNVVSIRSFSRVRSAGAVLPELLPAMVEALPNSGFIMIEANGFISANQARILAAQLRRAADQIDPPSEESIKSCIRRDDGSFDLVIDGAYSLSRIELLARSIMSIVKSHRRKGHPENPGGDAA
jgi:hypothetical protein